MSIHEADPTNGITISTLAFFIHYSCSLHSCVHVSTYISQAAHAAGMLTVIFIDRGQPDQTSLTFNAKSTALLQEEQQDKKGQAGLSGLRRHW